MLNKGETLIESLLSLLIISLALIPVFHSVSNTTKLNNIINNKIKYEIYCKNKLENIKSMDYDDFLNFYDADLRKYNTGYKYDLYKTEEIYKIKVGKYEDIYIP